MSHATANVSQPRKSQKVKSESLICDICFAVCYSQSDLKRHKQTHDGKTDLTCTFCGEVFQKESGMRRHQRHEHPAEILADTEEKTEDTGILITDKEPVVLLERADDNELLKRATGAVMPEEPFQQDTPPRKVPRARFRCKICSVSFGGTEEMMTHIEVHGKTEEDDVVVDVDKREEVGDKRKITEEIQTPSKKPKVSEGNIFTCQECFREFNTRASLMSHAVYHTQKSSTEKTVGVKSDIFEVVEVGNVEIGKDLQLHGDGSAVEETSLAAVVDECINKSISEQKGNQEEEEILDNTEDVNEILGQDIINYATQSEKTLKSSIKKKNLKDVLGTTTFHCTVCHNIFTNQVELEQHVESEHFIKLLNCNECDAVFPRKNNLLRHIRAAHKMEGSFDCYECSLNFTTKADLMIHDLTHTHGEFEDEKGDLVVNRRRSQIDTPIQCKDCDEIFLLKKDLKLHRRAVHKNAPIISSEAPVIIQDMVIKGEGRAVNVFRCNICPRSFNLKSDLMRHFLIHSGEKPFACDMCENRFNRKSNLVRHKKLMHHIEQAPSGRARRFPELEWGAADAMRRKPHRKQPKKEEWEIEDEEFAEEERRLLQKLLEERKAEWENQQDEDQIFQDSDEYYEEIEDDEFVEVGNETQKNEGEMEVMVIEPGDQVTVRILTF